MDPEQYARLKEQYPKFNEPWTEDEDRELKQMAGDGVPVSQMVEQLQRTRNSVRMRMQKWGLLESKPAAKPWSESEEQMLVQMYQNGKPFEEMAATLGRTSSAVVSRLVRLRINLFE